MRRLAVTAVVAAALASLWATTAVSDNIPQPTHKPTPARCTAKAFKPFSQRVWLLIRWERGAPPKSTIRAQRRRLRCAPPRHRKAMRYRWRGDKRVFYEHRKNMLALIALTPYECGSAGRFAIPCDVVECESHFDWGEVNSSSGAFTAYQFLPSTYAEACVRCDGSRIDYHETAAIVWARSGGSEWVCAG